MALHSELNQTQEEHLQEILAAYLRDAEAGRNPDQAEILARHPDLAGELQEFFAGQEQLGRLAAPLRQAINPAPGAEITGTLGDFRIVREVGRGGMGVVYEAEQISLRRRVALKVLPFAATMDPRHLQRFHNEAQAAACLHHTNIVPVHYVGSERGVHFYAMQFIDGQPLSELIHQMRRLETKAPAAEGVHTVAYQPPPDEAASTPVPAAELTPLTGEGRRGRDYFRKVADLGVQAAEALDHAHQLGIVHRDIKPANLLLDGRGNLWVTDFGLAHMQHSEASLTGTGQMVGTPRYMSPEQALAKRVPIDHRTDVYSLGVTLYELLTLRPAFGSEDRQELLRLIAFEEPPRPRRSERTIPAELEIIVLKAMEKRPQDRYATAQELADDLERWLRHEPIRARRPALFQRAAKWVRRHKPATAASAVVLLMALLLAGYIAWTRYDRTLRRAASAQVVLAALKESQKWQAERRLPEALSTARRAEGLLAGADVEEALRQRVRSRVADLQLLERLENVRLENGSAVKDGHFDNRGTDPLYGQVFRDFGLDVEALSEDEAAKRIRGSTVAVELAAILNVWAVLRKANKGADDPSWKTLLRIARLADPDPWRMRVRQALENMDNRALRELAASEEVFRLLPSDLTILGAALIEHKENLGHAETFLREAQRQYPNDFWINQNLYSYYRHFNIMQPPRVEDVLRFATVAVALRPHNPGVHLNLGEALLKTNRLDDAIAEYREAIRLKEDYAEAHNGLGCALCNKGQVDAAIDEYRQAIRLKSDFAPAHYNLGVSLRIIGRLDDAIVESREAIRLKEDYGEAYLNLGVALKATGQIDAAIAVYHEALRIKKDFAEARESLGTALLARGQLDAAIAEYREAIRLNKDYAGAHCSLGNALRDKGRLEESIAECREAIRLEKNNLEAHNNLGNALKDKGQLDEAIAEYREALRLNKDAAHVHHNLSIALQGVGRLDEAIAECREAVRLEKDFAEAHCNLGQLLVRKGLFAEALEYTRLGHELGSKKPHWPHPTAQWVRNCERLLELDGKLLPILKGQKQPADTTERLTLAKMCQQPYKQQHVAAVRFYREAFADTPQLADNLDALHRYNAACSAALAGCGQGKDAGKLDANERARLRRQALDWLRADLKVYRQVLEKSAGKAGQEITQRMQHWLQDGDFTGVRGDESLAKLPAEERSAWRKLWADVAELLAEAQRKAPAEKKPDAKK